MGLGEFDLIGRYFSRTGTARRETLIGVGDDAALLAPTSSAELLTCWATHYPSPSTHGGEMAAALVDSCLAQVPSHATPRWLLLALTVANAEEPWLPDFAAELDTLCRCHALQLVGGDTTRGVSCVELHCLAVAEPRP